MRAANLILASLIQANLIEIRPSQRRGGGPSPLIRQPPIELAAHQALEIEGHGRKAKV